MISASIRTACLASVLWAVAGTAHAAPDLVTNGSMNFVNGKPDGWELLNPGGELFNSFDPGNGSADGGSFFGIQDLDNFAPRKNAGGLKQTIAGLDVGGHYTLTFESNEQHTNPNFLAQWRVSFGGETQLSSLTNTTWVTDIMHFTASSTTQTLQFVATFLPGALPQILNLDGVHLSADAAPVPVPTSGWLVLPALLGLVRMSKRRKAD